LPTPIPIRLLIDTPHGELALTPERAEIPLPAGPESQERPLTYGPYLGALAEFLSRDSCRALTDVLSRHRDFKVSLSDIESLDIVSRKHGALYNVAEVRVKLADTRISFALNAAAGHDRQTVLERELHLLEDLWARFRLPFLPRAYLLDEVPLRAGPGDGQTLRLFVAEWFDGYQEFHLSEAAGHACPLIRVWDGGHGGSILGPAETGALYHRASVILTAYFDEHTFEQIYPWHHAAGDFVLRHGNGKIDVRLVTARGFRSLFPRGGEPDGNIVAIVHFFLNLTFRMRLDRLDGTGKPAWAEPSCLRPVIAGFRESWERKRQSASEALPSAEEILGLVGSLSVEELLALSELVVENGLVEADEFEYLRPRMEEHVHALQAAFGEGLPAGE
jgi:hypothetical protein